MIPGAGGQLGRDLVKRFSRTHEVSALTHDAVDVADAEAVQREADRIHPELMLNAAAYTDVERAEEDEAAAFRINADGARNAAAAAAAFDAPIVYFSTDYVFDGAKGEPYEPDDPVCPLSVYGRSKLEGERATVNANPRSYIVRTAWLYGGGGNHFVEKILRLAKERDRMRVVEDETGSPTYTHDLAEATVALIAKAPPGCYHVVNEGACSRYELARTALAAIGSKTAVEPCATSEFPTKAIRPLYSVLSNRVFCEATGHRMPDWRSALERYLKRRIENP